MKFYLFPVDYQFQPKVFNSLSELEIYCREHNIINVFKHCCSSRSKFLFSRWKMKYFSRDYLRTYVGI